jgi:hypothetical protein
MVTMRKIAAPVSGLSTGCATGPVADSDDPVKAAGSSRFEAGERPKCTDVAHAA